jgi:hypothetical protein
MKNKMLTVLSAALVLTGCGSADVTPIGTTGVGGDGSTSSISSSVGGSTSSSVSSSTGGQVEIPVVLDAGCVANRPTPPIIPEDGIVNSYGNLYDENGALAVRCFKPENYPTIFDKFSYFLQDDQNSSYKCGSVNHQAVVFLTPTLPINQTSKFEVVENISSTDIYWLGNTANVAVTLPKIEVTSGYICGGVTLTADVDLTRLCVSTCHKQAAEIPDQDYFSVDGNDGLPVCVGPKCELISLDSSPDPQSALLAGTANWKFGYQFDGVTKK